VREEDLLAARDKVEREFNFQTRTRELEAIYTGLVAERRA
jgi:hypothetical protein